MTPYHFGKLVQALRKEHRDEQDRVWTQDYLAQKAKIPKRTIERIEAGTAMKIDVDNITRLANAFELTTAERKEFFLAALEIEPAKIASPDFDSEVSFTKLTNIVASIQLPAFLYDCFSDIVACNPSVVRLMNIPPEVLALDPETPGAFNVMRYIFDPQFRFKELLGSAWDRSVRGNMQIFRSITLRYRNHSYFPQLFAELQKLSWFRSYWQSAYLDDEEIAAGSEYYEYLHPTLGHLRYVSNVSSHTTNRGELYLVLYAPANAQTNRAFSRLAEQSNNTVLRLAKWPKDGSS